MIRIKYLFSIVFLFSALLLPAQETYKEVKPVAGTQVYEGESFYPIQTFTQKFKSKKPKNIILMVEVSMIDWGAHQNNTSYLLEELLDFDRAVGKAFKFTARDGETLEIVPADHETGGVSIHDGNFKTGMVKANFNTTNHTAVFVPVFSYGPGANHFTGIMKNTDIQKTCENS